jgi:hypothetical protein
MRRREVIAGLRSAAAWPLAARAQQAGRIRRIGVLMQNAADDPGAPANISGRSSHELPRRVPMQPGPW